MRPHRVRRGHRRPDRHTGEWRGNAEENPGLPVSGDSVHGETNSPRKPAPGVSRACNSDGCHDRPVQRLTALR